MSTDRARDPERQPVPQAADAPHGQARSALGPLEARLMRLLWSRGSATVPELVDEVQRAGHRAAYTTILTVVTRLHRRGWLERTAEGRTHRYRPTLSEAELVERSSGAAVAAVLTRFGPVALRQFAIRLGDLDPETRRELIELAGGPGGETRPGQDDR